MIIKKQDKCEPKPSEITSHAEYYRRRLFLKQTTVVLINAFTPGVRSAGALAGQTQDKADRGILGNAKKSEFSTQEEPNSYYDITHYNNFYEFSTDKNRVSQLSDRFQTNPWSVEISGEVKRPGTYQLEDLLKNQPIEERIYRFRCVEAWSMVIPWMGIPLAPLIKSMDPTSKAKYVEFTTLFDPERMPGQKQNILTWPYVEGLRMDEAMNPLCFLATGLYGRDLPNQNGAPLRLVVPWKYGFKSIKSIIKINFMQNMPTTTWNSLAPREYGFFANVNPNVDHPRWSQQKERRIGDFFKQKTLLFNGYEEYVAHLYNGMDLLKNI